jgi:hypothetical protein
MSQKNELPVSLRNLKAKLRPLRQPIVWGTIGLLGLFTLFSWELWFNSAEFFLDDELSLESSGDLQEEQSQGDASDAIAADIDSSSVLKQDMKLLETPPPVLPNPPLPDPKPQKTNNRKPERSTPTPPTAPAPDRTNQNTQALPNILLSGNANQLQVSDLLKANHSGNGMNAIDSSGMNLWLGSSDINGNNDNAIAANQNSGVGTGNNGMAMSPLQEAIIRRSSRNSLPTSPANSGAIATPQTATTPGSAATASTSLLPVDANQNAIGATASTQTNQLLPNASTNLSNISGTTDTSPTAAQTPATPDVRGQVTPQAELLMPLSPASSRGVNSSQRGYNPDRQLTQNNYPNPTTTDSYNSYQYLLQSGGANPTTSGINSQGLVNPRSTPSLRTPIASPTYPPTYTQPNLPGNQSQLTTPNGQNYGQNYGTTTQPSVPTTTQPFGQGTPILRSVPIPQGVPTTAPNANGLTPTSVNSTGFSNSTQTLQPAAPFSVPRPIPGRYIGGGEINTFSNP